MMRELVRQKYPRGIYPEHPRAIDVDRERGHDPEPVSRRRRVRRRDLQRRLHQGDAAGGADTVTSSRSGFLPNRFLSREEPVDAG